MRNMCVCKNDREALNICMSVVTFGSKEGILEAYLSSKLLVIRGDNFLTHVICDERQT